MKTDVKTTINLLCAYENSSINCKKGTIKRKNKQDEAKNKVFDFVVDNYKIDDKERCILSNFISKCFENLDNGDI